MNDNLIQTKNILNYKSKTNSLRDTNIPRFTNLFAETNYAKYRREHEPLRIPLIIITLII